MWYGLIIYTDFKIFPFLENLLIEDTLVMDQLEKMRHNVDELTLTAKSRARVASEVG